MNYLIASLKHTNKCHEHITFWGRFNRGYTPVVGAYAGRYCYEHAHEARAALVAWDGVGHPPGPWIKCKGYGIDLLNPELKA